MKGLKDYLEYTESRGRGLGLATDRDFDSDFGEEVATRLRARGYTVDIQVGVSGFRIDLAVRHPDSAGTYVAGIECDGAVYHSSKSARDRDRLREEVLKSLGWSILRAWSTDWFESPTKETEKLIVEIEARAMADFG